MTRQQMTVASIQFYKLLPKERQQLVTDFHKKITDEILDFAYKNELKPAEVIIVMKALCEYLWITIEKGAKDFKNQHNN